MRIKLMHRDKKFVKDVVSHFKLKSISTHIPNRSINLKINDLVELSKANPCNLHYFSCQSMSGENVYVVSFMGAAIVFNEERSTIALDGNKHILFQVPQINLYLKPLLLTKEYLDIVSSNEKNVDTPWYELETKNIDGNQFLNANCPKCEAPVTMFQKKVCIKPKDKFTTQNRFEGPEFARKWLSEIPEACSECGEPTDYNESLSTTGDDNHTFEHFIHCNHCGYSTN